MKDPSRSWYGVRVWAHYVAQPYLSVVERRLLGVCVEHLDVDPLAVQVARQLVHQTGEVGAVAQGPRRVARCVPSRPTERALSGSFESCRIVFWSVADGRTARVTARASRGGAGDQTPTVEQDATPSRVVDLVRVARRLRRPDLDLQPLDVSRVSCQRRLSFRPRTGPRPSPAAASVHFVVGSPQPPSVSALSRVGLQGTRRRRTERGVSAYVQSHSRDGRFISPSLPVDVEPPSCDPG